ncbi:hypothetical protein OESDEN_10849 [Oesophagostomum dentatum]|uniref:Uncharacterized protein n=1 Tax=Oesophagostomum dentatum TaxID=61180 RepID=A0A0B1SVI7_OESDE|nr:hypothetical protein OESDEN_10849 [Oesophagostomum dentatum]
MVGTNGMMVNCWMKKISTCGLLAIPRRAKETVYTCANLMTEGKLRHRVAVLLVSKKVSQIKGPLKNS